MQKFQENNLWENQLQHKLVTTLSSQSMSFQSVLIAKLSLNSTQPQLKLKLRLALIHLIQPPTHPPTTHPPGTVDSTLHAYSRKFKDASRLHYYFFNAISRLLHCLAQPQFNSNSTHTKAEINLNSTFSRR